MKRIIPVLCLVLTTSAIGYGQTCKQSLLKHVYHPNRLIVKKKCVSVTGTIVDATNGKRTDGVRHEPDGDTHGWLKPDDQFTNLLNTGNKKKEGGNLVFEIICRFPISQDDAVAPQRGLAASRDILARGRRVSRF